jgi:hypothetical protein
MAMVTVMTKAASGQASKALESPLWLAIRRGRWLWGEANECIKQSCTVPVLGLSVMSGGEVCAMVCLRR